MAVRLKKSSEYSWRSTFITSVEGRRPENKEKTGWETEETEVISGGAAVIRLFCSHHLSPTCSCVTKEPADYATALSVCVCVCVSVSVSLICLECFYKFLRNKCSPRWTTKVQLLWG